MYLRTVIITFILLSIPCFLFAEIAYGESGIINLGPAVGNTQKATPLEKTFFNLNVMPNPFSTVVNIRVLLPIDDFKLPIKNISIYNITGKLVDKLTPIGNSIFWQAQDHPGGMYIVKATIGDRILTKRVVLIK